MGLEDNIAVVALVVSLIALLLTVTQLLQALFSTADGYRRCGEPVIGPWHRLRKSILIWSELRYETRFTTPKLLLVTPTDSPGAKPKDSQVYLLRPGLYFYRQPIHPGFEVLASSVQDSGEELIDLGRTQETASAARLSPRAQHVRPPHDVEKHPKSLSKSVSLYTTADLETAGSTHSWLNATWSLLASHLSMIGSQQAGTSQSGVTVTWISLVQQLYLLPKRDKVLFKAAYTDGPISDKQDARDWERLPSDDASSEGNEKGEAEQGLQNTMGIENETPSEAAVVL